YHSRDVTAEFLPAWFLPGPHLQTIWGRLARPRRLVAFRRESIETPDGDELVLDHLDTPVTAENPVHFLLVHGLEGSSYSVYMQGVLAHIARRGHLATAMNLRGCARDPRNLSRMLPNRRPRFSHSGASADFDCVVRKLVERHPGRRFAAFGASLGGNLLLKWLGENAGQTLVRAAATLSVPYDLGAGSRHLERSAPGRFYTSSFLATLKKKITDSAARFPEVTARVDLPTMLASRTFWQFDDAATAPLHGFRDANDYYTRSSSIHFIGAIDTPVLALNAIDDPFLPMHVLPLAEKVASPTVDFRTTPFGGHCGFISGRAPWRCEYWAEELAVNWMLERA
ncbi:MAG TPA: alpha/beta fold hydrolase, partial [Thermoanaerobaculia bacterium]